MSVPALTVELAFGSGYSTAVGSRVWTNVTPYVLHPETIGIGGGRQNELSTADANSLRLVFDNSDGRFTPGKATLANVLTAGDNGTFEDNATGWFGSNATVARTTAQAQSGSASLSVTASTAADMAAQTDSGLLGIPVTANTSYTASAYYRAAATARTVFTRVTWYDATGGLISQVGTGTTTDTTTGWTQHSITETSPANAAYARVRCLVSSPAGGEVHYVDTVTFAQAHPYYPNVKIGVPVRVKATPSGQSPSVRYLGYVDEWPISWPGVKGSFAATAISATSRLARLAAGTALRSIVEEQIRSRLYLGPVAYYTLGEAEGATFASDTSGNGQPNLTQVGTGTAVGFGLGTGPTTDGLPAAQFTPSTGTGNKRLQGSVSFTATSATVEAAFAVASGNSGMSLVLAKLLSADPDHYVTLLLADGGIKALVHTAAGDDPVVNNAGGGSLDNGSVHHAAMVFTAGTPATLEVFVDGVSAGSDTGTATWPTVTQVEVGDFTVSSGTDKASVAHVAVHASALNSTSIGDHADACLTGFAGETATDRIVRYLEYAGMFGEYSISALATTPIVHVDTTGQTALDMLRKVEVTEGGVLFDKADNTLTYHDRSRRYGAAAAFTLDVAAGEVQPDYAPNLDRSTLINIAQATNGDRTVDVTVDDTASRNTYGDHSKSFELVTTDDDEPFQRASWEVGVHAEPGQRAPSLTVELGKFTAADQAALLALTVGHRIDVANLMGQAPNAAESFFIEGWTETMAPGLHTLTFNVSPADPYEVWILGDAVQGVLGATTRLAY